MSDNTEQIDSDEELEQAYGDSAEKKYTVAVNGKEYALNQDIRESIVGRAEGEYRENAMFDCFWKVASPDQYEEGAWEETIHDPGDPVLVIVTEGPFVPWDRLDRLDVEMQQAEPDSQFDGVGQDDDETEDIDNGNDLKMVPPEDRDDDDVDMKIGRTHFAITPKSFEEVPSPDGEDPEKIPPKPLELEEPSLVKWIPEHPDIEHTWSAGEAICPMFNRVEWNVQKKADQPRLTKDKDTSHDLWESTLQTHGCEVVAELGPSQDVPSGQSKSSGSEDEEPEDIGPKYNGDNWQV